MLGSWMKQDYGLHKPSRPHYEKDSVFFRASHVWLHQRREPKPIIRSTSKQDQGLYQFQQRWSDKWLNHRSWTHQRVIDRPISHVSSQQESPLWKNPCWSSALRRPNCKFSAGWAEKMSQGSWVFFQRITFQLWLLDELPFSTGGIFQSEEPVQVIWSQITLSSGNIRGNLSTS